MTDLDIRMTGGDALADTDAPVSPDEDRRRWLAVLARATRDELEAALRELELPARSIVRAPEVGMVMLRGRIGGDGVAFNVGEASVTRCALQTASGHLGVGYVLGRDRRRAELVALLDALLQDDARRDTLLDAIVRPLGRAQQQRREEASRGTASSRVEFFTLVRGDS
jgi:alpha-D-ribose 1-methylphosphonate 5-triphosphate synthase subunit PhnG